MYFKDKKILLIGGTGTIGRCLLNKILLDEPRLIKVFSRDEHKQSELKTELGNLNNVKYIIGDIRNYDSVQKAMIDLDYVLHAASMKQVDSCECNPFEAVQTNIIGTNNVINAALEKRVKRVVFTSTDKAVSPINAYGATKLTAERLIIAAQNNQSNSDTIFSIVRFGNVLGSRGSVIPIFKSQILKKRKITVTDMNMTRFMMSINQAANLTINALQESKGKEIFILKMPVIRLENLVYQVINLVCNKYGIKQNDIKIEQIGVKIGEKKFEELMTDEESKHAFEQTKMYIIANNLIDCNDYVNLQRAKIGSYNSDNEQPLGNDGVRELLISENLI